MRLWALVHPNRWVKNIHLMNEYYSAFYPLGASLLRKLRTFFMGSMILWSTSNALVQYLAIWSYLFALRALFFKRIYSFKCLVILNSSSVQVSGFPALHFEIQIWIYGLNAFGGQTTFWLLNLPESLVEKNGYGFESAIMGHKSAKVGHSSRWIQSA